MTTKKKLTSFKKFSKDKKQDRSAHFSWKQGDVSIVPVKETEKLKGLKEEVKKHALGDTVHNPIVEPDHQGEHHLMGSHHPEMGEVKHHLSKTAHRDFIEHHKTLEAAQEETIADYKDNSRNFNGHLRENRTPSMPVLRLDKALNHKTTEDHVVYRGFSGKIPLNNLHKGSTLHDKGFTGASFDKHVALGFSHSIVLPDKNKVFHEHRYLAKIHLPKGTKAHYLDNANSRAGHNCENELLIHRGTTFKVTKHAVSSSKKTWRGYQHTHLVHMTVAKQEDH